MIEIGEELEYVAADLVRLQPDAGAVAAEYLERQVLRLPPDAADLLPQRDARRLFAVFAPQQPGDAFAAFDHVLAEGEIDEERLRLAAREGAVGAAIRRAKTADHLHEERPLPPDIEHAPRSSHPRRSRRTRRISEFVQRSLSSRRSIPLRGNSGNPQMRAFATGIYPRPRQVHHSERSILSWRPPHDCLLAEWTGGGAAQSRRRAGFAAR